MRHLLIVAAAISIVGCDTFLPQQILPESGTYVGRQVLVEEGKSCEACGTMTVDAHEVVLNVLEDGFVRGTHVRTTEKYHGVNLISRYTTIEEIHAVVEGNRLRHISLISPEGGPSWRLDDSGERIIITRESFTERDSASLFYDPGYTNSQTALILELQR